MAVRPDTTAAPMFRRYNPSYIPGEDFQMVKIKKRTKTSKKTQEQHIATITQKVTAVLSSYKQQATIAASVLLVILVIAGGYMIMRSSSERKASPLLEAAYEYYSPSGAVSPDYVKALDLYRGIRTKYPRTMSAAIAQYYIGNSLAALGKMDEALKAYQSFIDTYSGEKYLLRLVYQRMGYVYRELGKQADAIKAFEHADALGGPGVATIELARMYEAAGNKIESQKKYQKVEAKLAGMDWGIEAMGKVQAIKPTPQPAAEKTGK
jgi:tetratricopeptide (TPR) repeat protein